MSTLAGLITIRNGFTLDYPWVEVGQSLLGVCDELVIGDISSEDGTWDYAQEWAAKDKRVTLVRTEWTNPIRTDQWWPEVLNRTREHAKSQHVLHLDGDEIIHEDDYPSIRRAADAGSILFCKRLNFWRDSQHLIPEGQCCGTKVLRIAPANMPIPSDYPWTPANATVAQAVESDIRVFHYGFLRKREAFFKKAREVQRIWCGSYDPRLEAAEKFHGQWSESPGITGWENALVEYHGTHPKAIHAWLRERNYSEV